MKRLTLLERFAAAFLACITAMLCFSFNSYACEQEGGADVYCNGESVYSESVSDAWNAAAANILR